MSDVTPEGGTPEWATSVNAFAAASRKSVTTTSATQLQFPETSQLTGVCSNALSGSAFMNGLLNYGDPNTQGVAGATIWGTQATADTLCGMMGGLGVDTTPQAVVAGATDVKTTVDNSPMASGTIALGQDPAPAGNVALDALNGVQTLANTLYAILNGCGCGAQNDPVNVTPQQVIDTTQETADGVTGSPFASGIIAMGQTPEGSGNVALDAINGSQFFAGTLFNTLLGCAGCGLPAGDANGQLLDGGQFTPPAEQVTTLDMLDGRLLTGIDTVDGEPSGLLAGTDPNPYSPYNVSAQTILDVASDTADVWAANPFAQDIVGAGSGNMAMDALYYGQDLIDSTHAAISSSVTEGMTAQDVINAGGQAIDQNTANHQSHTSLTSAQSVNLLRQNLLVSQDFSTAATVAADPDGRWVHDATDGATTLGCLKYTAAGVGADYVSSEVAVVLAETIEIACEVKTVGLTYTGTEPIKIGVEKFRKGRISAGVTYLDVGHYDLTGTGVAALTSPAADMAWTGVAGTYVVEPGVDQIRMRFSVAATATAGVVKFDEGELVKLDLIKDECVPGVGQTTDALVVNLYGAQGEGFSHNDAAVALANTASTVSTTAAKVAALEAEQIATGGGGAIAGDDFDWSGELIASANWGGNNTEGTGKYTANGAGLAVFSDAHPDTTNARFDWQGTDAVSDTDYQISQIVLGSAPTYQSIHNSVVYVYGRVSADWRNWIRFGVDAYGRYQITRCVNNVETVMRDNYTAMQYLDVPGNGAVLTLQCGNKDTAAPRYFKATINGTTIEAFTEAGTNSMVGADYRKYGWGAMAEGGYDFGFIPTQAIAAKVSQWLGLDQ